MALSTSRHQQDIRSTIYTAAPVRSTSLWWWWIPRGFVGWDDGIPAAISSRRVTAALGRPQKFPRKVPRLIPGIRR